MTPSGSIARRSALPPPARCDGGVQRGREVGQLPVQEHGPDLQRGEHAGAIGLEEHVVGQVVDLVEAHQPADRRLAVELAGPGGEVAEHPVAPTPASAARTARRRAVASLGGDPVEVALEQRRGRQPPRSALAVPEALRQLRAAALPSGRRGGGAAAPTRRAAERSSQR